MLIGVAGIPQPYFNRFQQQGAKIFGAGHTVIGVPSRSDQGSYSATGESADKLIARITDLAVKKPAVAGQGLAILFFAHDWSNTDVFEQRFALSALTLRVRLPHPVPEKGNEGRRAANQMLTELAAAAHPLLRAVKAISTELEARLKRTPLLLPIRNFSSACLGEALGRLSTEILHSHPPQERLKQACAEIEAEHPFRGGAGKKGFVDLQAILFGSPGRDLHGRVWETHGEHNALCTLNGLFRLGGPIARGFHYDCVRPPRLAGDFPNCHDCVGPYVGKPHLNIAPNDFVRI